MGEFVSSAILGVRFLCSTDRSFHVYPTVTSPRPLRRWRSVSVNESVYDLLGDPGLAYYALDLAQASENVLKTSFCASAGSLSSV